MKPQILIACLAISLPALANDLVPNGSFEELKRGDMFAGMDMKTRGYYGGTTQSPFEGWTFGGRWDKGDYTVAVSDEARSGKQSCQITCVRKGRGGIACAPVKLKAGEIIKVSLSMKAQGATGGSRLPQFRRLSRRRLGQQGPQDRHV